MHVDGANFITGGGDQNRWYTVPESSAESIYSLLKKFWSTRTSESEEAITQHIKDYRKSNFKPGYEFVLQSIVVPIRKHSLDRPFRILDLGGANCSIMHALKRFVRLDNVQYFNIEPFDRFVEDCHQSFGDDSAIVGDVESFIEMADDELPFSEFDLFFCSGVLCMVPPRLAVRVLEKASRLSRIIVLWDMMSNAKGEIHKSEIVVFDYLPQHQQMYFGHRFVSILDDLGFTTQMLRLTPIKHATAKKGWGVIQASRRGRGPFGGPV